MTRVLIVTGQHFATQPRKVDLHFMAEALNARGIRVDFLSMRLSLVSRLMSDERWAFAKTRALNQWTEITPLLGEFIWVSTVHPISLGKPILDLVSKPLAKVYGRHIPRAAKAELPEYTHVLVESGISILTIPEIRRLAPKARIIYHAADRLSTIGAHPAAHAVLRESIGAVDLVHVMADAIRGDIPEGAPTIHLPHGISRATFDRIGENPYSASKNAVSVGDMLFDADMIRTLATGYPDWTFHLFGRLARLEEALPNVIAHGERPFDEVAAYIKFADIGIAPYRPKEDADYLSQSSLKMIQYSYCRLPIVAPRFAAAGRSHVLAYEPGDAGSIQAAFKAATEFDRSAIDTSGVLSWEEKTARLFDLDSATPSSPHATRLSA
ncbi:GumK N-terminal domain-containing glycosyltransferase [Rhizobium sp. LjRoot254]|uniref:GumK N-terminal domain-containing glycosyltransferase n=1 Tax=Rhizobium sp. LjRoot254 TaxID=3342297 RepID=UPI003ECD917B